MESIYHSSHLHPLQLVQASDHVRFQTRCCDLTATTMKNDESSNTIYGCKSCKFYIHKNCAELHPYVRHPSHPSHTLTLVHASPYLQGTSECSACLKAINGGAGFFYHCTHCSFDIHTGCAFLPSTINNSGSDAHPHRLTLHYPNDFSFIIYKCDICRRAIAAEAWFYCCQPCDFQAHTDCFLAWTGGSLPPVAAAANSSSQPQTATSGNVENSNQAHRVPEMTSNGQQQLGRQQQLGDDGEIPEHIALQLEMMKLQAGLNAAQTANNIISNWNRPFNSWY